MKRTSNVRYVNGIVSACLVLLFFIHEILGAVTGITLIPDQLKWLVWIGVGGIMAHIGLSGATTVEMMDDQERPPSRRKRNHQIKKWITGGIVAFLAIIHMALGGTDGSGAVAIVGVWVNLLLAIAIAYHICVGMKSLTTDIGAPSSLRMPARVVTVAITVIVAVLLFMGNA